MTQFALDHLWQSTLFAAGGALLNFAFRTNGAHVRFALWFAASLKFLVPFPLIVEIGKLISWSSAPSVPAEAPWVESVGNLIAPSKLIAPLSEVPVRSAPLPDAVNLPLASGAS